MILDAYGMPIPEENDFASPDAIVNFGMAADARLGAMDGKLDLLERPPCVIGSLSAPQGPNAYGNYEVNTNFDTTDFANWGGSVNNGLWFAPYPGIWRVGTTINLQLAGGITSFRLRLQVEDKRGPRLENTILEDVQATTKYSGIGPCVLSTSGMFEIHNTSLAFATSNVRVISGGAGNFTIATSSTCIWAYRVRGLSNV